MASIGDVFLRLLLDDADFEKQVVARGEKAGAKAGLSMGAAMVQGISKGSADLGKTLAGIGSGLTKTGRALTTNLTLPLLAAGGAATHFALDFDTKMRQIVALSDVTQAQIGGIREQILKLGPEIGKSPQELADAFYLLASSGLSAESAMQALTIAGKASATGMGLTTDIAKVLASTINAYGKENITAARAGDVLTAAVKDGSAEATDIAGSIGRVVPVAAALGVTFDQVSAAMAAMTLSGISTDEATTSLVQIFSALLKTTPSAEAAMNQLGLSSAGLRQELREKGLIATLKTLNDAFGSNETAAAAVFGNIRALRGITALLGLDEAQLNKVFADTKGALGDLEQGYKETDGPQRSLDKSMADLQATAIELGADTMPVVVDVLKQIATAAKTLGTWWSSLDADTRKQIVSWLAWIAIAGPVLVVAGKLVSTFGAIFKAIGFLTSARGIPALIGALKTSRLALLGWLGVAIAITEALQAASGPVSDFFDTLEHGKKANKTLHELNDITGDMLKAGALRAMGIDAKEFAKAVEAAGGDVDAAFQAIHDSAGDLGAALDQLSLDSEPTKLFPGWGTRDPTKIQAALDDARKNASGMSGDLAATLENGAFVVAPAAQKMVDPIDEAMAKAQKDLADAANELIHTLATTIASNPKELQDAAKAMWDDILHPFPDIKNRLQIEAILANKTLIKGLTSTDSGDRARTAEYIKSLLANYDELAPGALAAGKLINPALQSGIDSTMAVLLTYLESKTGQIANQFDLARELETMGYHDVAQYILGLEQARSDKLATTTGLIRRQVKADLLLDSYHLGYDVSENYASGLREGGKTAVQYVQDYTGKIAHLMTLPGSPEYYHAREAGETVGLTYMQRLIASVRSMLPHLGAAIGQVAGSLALQPMGLAAAAVPSMSGMAAVSGAGIGGGGSTVNNTWQLVLNGVPYTFKNRDDFIKALDDLSAFNDGRQAGG